MSDLDEIDRRILRMLLADARRSYREIADEVGRSAPTVSNRVEQLRDLGVIRRFTLDIDRSLLSGTAASLVTVRTRPDRAPAVAESLAGRESVEHVYRTVEGTVVAGTVLEGEAIHDLLADLTADLPVVEWSVDPIAASDWRPELGVTGGFGLECAICGNEVGESGGTVGVETGDRYAVCCSSCATAVSEEYDRLSEDERSAE